MDGGVTRRIQHGLFALFDAGPCTMNIVSTATENVTKTMNDTEFPNFKWGEWAWLTCQYALIGGGNCQSQHTYTHTRLTALFRDYPGEPVPER